MTTRYSIGPDSVLDAQNRSNQCPSLPLNRISGSRCIQIQWSHTQNIDSGLFIMRLKARVHLSLCLQFATDLVGQSSLDSWSEEAEDDT